MSNSIVHDSKYLQSYIDNSPLVAVHLSQRHNKVAIFNEDGWVKFWSIEANEVDNQGDIITTLPDRLISLTREFCIDIKRPPVAISMSLDESYLAVVTYNGELKVFDFAMGDMICMIEIEEIESSDASLTQDCQYPLYHLCWTNSALYIVQNCCSSASTNSNLKSAISVINAIDFTFSHKLNISSLHRFPLSFLVYSNELDGFISGDTGGFIEFWAVPEADMDCPKFTLPKDVAYSNKSSTDFYALRKEKQVPVSAALDNKTGTKLAMISRPDSLIRIFDLVSGRIISIIDINSSDVPKFAGKDIEKAQRLALETDFLNNVDNHLRWYNLEFIYEDSCLAFGCWRGICIANIQQDTQNNDKKQRISFIGTDDFLRCVCLRYFAKTNLILATCYRRNRLYIYNSQTQNQHIRPNQSKSFQRDIVIEPDITQSHHDDSNDFLQEKDLSQARRSDWVSGEVAILHTTLGDIKIELFSQLTPKTVQNFCTLASSRQYYNNCIFHRVIKQFMIQTGDPEGDGTGGTSIYGDDFEDEITHIKHDQPFMVSMANAGPNTNASQFFITTRACPWLDGKHTIFGKVISGQETVQRIEQLPTKLQTDCPLDPPKIISIDMS